MITIEMQSQQKILYIQLKGRYFIIVNTFSSNSTIHVGIAPWRMLTTTKEVVEQKFNLKRLDKTSFKDEFGKSRYLF